MFNVREFKMGNFLDPLSQHNFIILYVDLSILVIDRPSHVKDFVTLNMIDVGLHSQVNRSAVTTAPTALRCTYILAFELKRNTPGRLSDM